MVISPNKYQDQYQEIAFGTKRTTIAIIGGGFSGVMVAVHLLRNATFPLTIKLIESRRNLGQGVAYSTNLDCHLLNVPAVKMSAFADQPGHFLHWLQSREDLTFKVQADTFVPRKYYGQYLKAILDEAIANADPQVSLECLTDEAVALKTNSPRAAVYLKRGEILEVERVVLALGNFPPANPPLPDSNLAKSDRYISSPWSIKGLSELPSEEQIILIGSGLTAVDLVAALAQQGHQGKIQIVSRRGLLPQAHQSSAAYHPFLITEEAPQTIRALLRLVREEVKQAKALGFDWRSVIDALRPQTQAIWQKLSLTEKRRFLRHVRPYWEIHRHRLVSAIAETVNKLIESKQLVVRAGRIQACYEYPDGVNVLIRERCSGESEILRAGMIINCTGSECDYRQLKQPLIWNLLASEQIRPDRLRLGLDVAPNGALIDKSGNISQQLFTLGAPQKGCLWETTAVSEVREQAKNLAQELLKIQLRV